MSALADLINANICSVARAAFCEDSPKAINFFSCGVCAVFPL
jgi:hypothetical protein